MIPHVPLYLPATPFLQHAKLAVDKRKIRITTFLILSNAEMLRTPNRAENRGFGGTTEAIARDQVMMCMTIWAQEGSWPYQGIEQWCRWCGHRQSYAEIPSSIWQGPQPHHQSPTYRLSLRSSVSIFCSITALSIDALSPFANYTFSVRLVD